MAVTIVLTASGSPSEPRYRHVDVQAHENLIQDKEASGLPDRRLVQAIHVYGVQGSQSRFKIDLKKDAGMQHLWRGAHYPVGPKDAPLYIVDDPNDDYHHSLIWGTRDANGNLETPEWYYSPTLADGTPE
jgi:hypothetical protein